MLEWESVIENKELIEQVERLVNEVADEYFDFPQDICDELNELTGNNWDGDGYLDYCAGYWESPWSLQEVVFALFHDGKYPDRRNENIYIWDIEETIDTNEEAITFFRLGKYMKDSEKCSKYKDIRFEDICKELKEAFSTWAIDDGGDSWYCSNKECYGYEKDIYIHNSYDNKFLNCTITNLSDVERESFMDIMRKWCSHVEKA